MTLKTKPYTGFLSGTAAFLVAMVMATGMANAAPTRHDYYVNNHNNSWDSLNKFNRIEFGITGSFSKAALGRINSVTEPTVSKTSTQWKQMKNYSLGFNMKLNFTDRVFALGSVEYLRFTGGTATAAVNGYATNAPTINGMEYKAALGVHAVTVMGVDILPYVGYIARNYAYDFTPTTSYDATGAVAAAQPALGTKTSSNALWQGLVVGVKAQTQIADGIGAALTGELYAMQKFSERFMLATISPASGVTVGADFKDYDINGNKSLAGGKVTAEVNMAVHDDIWVKGFAFYEVNKINGMKAGTMEIGVPVTTTNTNNVIWQRIGLGIGIDLR